MELNHIFNNKTTTQTNPIPNHNSTTPTPYRRRKKRSRADPSSLRRRAMAPFEETSKKNPKISEFKVEFSNRVDRVDPKTRVALAGSFIQIFEDPTRVVPRNAKGRSGTPNDCSVQSLNHIGVGTLATLLRSDDEDWLTEGGNLYNKICGY
ncbi:hypothetical protein Tco_0478366 [Tanacetum coccineum]